MHFFHSLLCVLIQFLILRLMGRTVTAIFTTFCFQMVKLFLAALVCRKEPPVQFCISQWQLWVEELETDQKQLEE